MKKILLFIAVLVTIGFLTNESFAKTIYIIKKGDNPIKIAKKFDVKASDIIKINNLKPKYLKPGTKIVIPSNKNKARNTQEDLENNNKSNYKNSDYEQTPDENPVYIVRKGDTLYSISREFSTSISELKKLNHLSSSKLKIGQRLLINKVSPEMYTVKKGDSLYRIARKFDTNIESLRDINELEGDILMPGQKILLKPPLEIKEMKTYESIMSHQEEGDEENSIVQTATGSDDVLSLNEKLVFFAKKLLNIPYRFGGNSLLGIDCSAFVQKVYKFVGIDLPRSARQQFNEGEPVDKTELSTGDLVFFRTYASFPSHVGIYMGNNLFIHASSKSKKVTIGNLETPYYLKRFIGAKRVLRTEESEKIENEG